MPAPVPAEPTDVEEVKGSRKKLFLAAGGGLVLALAAAWFLVLAPPGSSGPVEPTEPEAGEVVSLEPITMNLADGRLLKVGLAVQLEKIDGEAETPFSGAMALDEAITVLGERTFADLSAPGGREKAKSELSHRVAERYEHGVLSVLFTQFVMQ